MTTQHTDAGFSLIEMMTALAIVAIAGLALMNLTRTTTQNTAAVETRALAALAAENLLNTEWLRADAPEARSGRYELGGVSYDWRTRIAQTGEAGLVRIHIELTESGQDQVLASLDTFRRVPS
ncbi:MULTISPECIES: type II secretion system minor pseudopilin GspI [Maricaulis]|uniref:Type II secretion system protein I n=1 Tax=Maricaulis maris TaxID=74318 RepID=A0A495D4L0_9PROT|nr:MULTISPECIES: type II secretion system minor pseudopilin GspI [Maricaulis]RKQ96171.1 general secretion pathway protein I [Maricaulis maris]